ncbi:hypothetical protein [Methylobacterium indicum]|uniref:Uncharacterized protein n=1 Tax=Methylobacterium indicum TaxID=1775910 RepID=A0ABR5HHF8_9HYPH|nr:hypothetical protein [Methylobacterium indicum]KMO16201.1 hypothetical protein QR78_20050 [Methylobacterium indicum]KMO25993.1 hypothetical protein QR79_04860 [Methylobacterium indicum]
MPEPERDGNPTGLDQAYAAEAQAALMLVESLMLVLVERRVIPAADLVEAVETVIETKRRLTADGREPAVATQAAALLTTIANSLAAAAPPAKR